MDGLSKFDYEEQYGENDDDFAERENPTTECSNCDYQFPSDEISEIIEEIDGKKYYLYLCSQCKKEYNECH